MRSRRRSNRALHRRSRRTQKSLAIVFALRGSAQEPPPLTIEEGWQPFLGIGANYTIFFDEETTKGLDGTLDAVLGASEVDLDLDNSFGLSAQAGVDIPFAKNWAISLAVWYIDLQTNATVSTDVGDVNFKTDINPFVYIEDVARSNILALLSEVSDDVFNVASGVDGSGMGGPPMSSSLEVAQAASLVTLCLEIRIYHRLLS